LRQTHLQRIESCHRVDRIDARRHCRATLGPQDDESTDDETARHHRRIEKLRLDQLAQRQAQHHRRRECDRHVGDEGACPHARAELEHGVAQALPIDQDHSEHRAALDRDLEHLGFLTDKAEQRPRQDKVPGRRDRQEFGQAFDDAHQRGLGQQHPVQHPPSRVRRA
jgi:hypothetical protein